MSKQSWWQSWAHILLWSHVIGVVGFYITIWRRTMPKKDDRVTILSPENTTSPISSQVTPLASIIVPARNEEQNIRRCVQSLLEQDYANYEVIVVDDESTDRTGEILDELVATHPHGNRLWVLRLRDLPEGWAGKPHALHMGCQEARGEWLLFTDADTWHAPNALRSSLTQAIHERADLLTLGSTQELPTFWDKVLMPMAFLGISMLYPPKLVNDSRSKVAIANGQYILIKRTVYTRLGGYARPELKGTLLDDRDLARLIKEHGYKLRFVDGRGLVSVHMYHGFKDIWRGWRKNAYLGNRGGIAFFVLQLIGLPMVSVVPFLLPLLAYMTRKRRKAGISAAEAQTAATLELSSLLAYRTWLNKQLCVPWIYSLFHPLAGIIFEGILAESAWRILTRSGVDWRGRYYHNGGREKKT
ncbi:MAG TPA: glycosyltransferase [Ktedonobacteraceae bacterium]|nr:glycosyltransferase [Ktedonobacteraceae bacterium]